MLELLAWILAFVVAITVHEAAHAYMADKLGDPTPRLMGRLSLNPIVHYDPIGTTLLLVLIFMRTVLHIPVIPFGWAKPVMFDPFNLKNPRKDAALISLAGPASNFIIAIIASIVFRVTLSSFPLFSFFVAPIIILNVVLGLFNLIPIHPLDGGKIFVGLLPADQAKEADLFLRRYGTLILIFLIFPTFGGQSPLFTVLNPLINIILSVLLGTGRIL
jgi:Zn-dependent protease